MFLQTDFPYTHDLDRLRGLLPEGWPVKENPPDLSGLTFWATRGRYPGSRREATEDEAREAVEQARRAYETTLEDLKSHGYAPDDEEVRREAEKEE